MLGKHRVKMVDKVVETCNYYCDGNLREMAFQVAIEEDCVSYVRKHCADYLGEGMEYDIDSFIGIAKSEEMKQVLLKKLG